MNLQPTDLTSRQSVSDYQCFSPNFYCPCAETAICELPFITAFSLLGACIQPPCEFQEFTL